jgi:hypothetical protein
VILGIVLEGSVYAAQGSDLVSRGEMDQRAIVIYSGRVRAAAQRQLKVVERGLKATCPAMEHCAA